MPPDPRSLAQSDPVGQLYPLVGEAGFARLTAAFYRRVRTDDVLGPMYPEEDYVGAEQRLRDFLVLRCGGPQRYLQQRGHPRLGMRHVPFAINQVARDRWMELMDRALEEADLPAEAAALLHAFFAQVATFLINRREG